MTKVNLIKEWKQISLVKDLSGMKVIILIELCDIPGAWKYAFGNCHC